GYIGGLGHECIEGVQVALDAIDLVLLAREFEQRGRIAAGHAGYDRVFACHVDFFFRQFRRLGTVADGGHQAIEIQWDFASSRRAPARPEKPAKIARFRNIPSTAVQHAEKPARGGRFCRPAALARAARAGATQAFPPLGLPDPSNVPRPAPRQAADATARVMLVAVSLAWGLSWPALKIALNDI